MNQKLRSDSELTRTLPLQGVQNFRDLGGYTGHGGRSIKWRHIFRSGHLAQVTEQDQRDFKTLGVRHVIDFRGAQERASAVCALADVQVHALPIEPTLHRRLEDRARLGGVVEHHEVEHFMRETYQHFVEHHTPMFKRLFELMLAHAEPLVFHCTYGKDRTGLAAVLVLHSLGVDAATIRHDYLLTNQLLQPAPLPGKVLTPKAQQVLLGVQADFLEAALNTIDASFGGMGAYLEQALGLDSTKRLALRNAYLV
jgi:protein-tyrosine phosphatase